MRGNIGDDARLSHIKDCITEIESAIAEQSIDTFNDNHVLRIAVVKWLEIIGEAANHISENTRNKYPQIEWQKIVGLRNIVVHEYFRIDFMLIWDAATVFLKQMKDDIDKIHT